MWLDKKISLYNSHQDKIGKPETFRKLLLSNFDFDTIEEIRELEKSHDEQQVDDLVYRKKKGQLKSQLMCFAPAALLKSRKSADVIEIERSGIMQLDFDHANIQEYNIEELQRSIFNLPFIGYCGLSCSGKGLYALALIAEPYKLREYAEHCFRVLGDYGLKVDTSKGRNISDLRYVSYDDFGLLRENPVPLKIKRFKPHAPAVKNKEVSYNAETVNADNPILNSGIRELEAVQIGSRWETVQRVCFTLGGLGDPSLMDSIKQAIENNESFTGEENKYLKCARICFNAGTEKPLQKSAEEDFACLL